MTDPSRPYRLKCHRRSSHSPWSVKWKPLPGRLAPFLWIMSGKYKGRSAPRVSVLWTCLSCIFGASIGRTFPRSRRVKLTYFPGVHFFSNSCRRRFAVSENRCSSKRWVLFFQRTPLQHFFPALYMALYVKTRANPPTARARSILRCSRFAFRLWYLASCRSWLVMSIRSSRGCGVGCVLSRFDRTHETGDRTLPRHARSVRARSSKSYFGIFREASLLSHWSDSLEATTFDLLLLRVCEIRRERARVICIVVGSRPAARPDAAEVIVVIVIRRPGKSESRRANIQRCTQKISLFSILFVRL